MSKKNKEMKVETNEFGLVSVSLRQKIRGCEIRSKKWLIYRSPLKHLAKEGTIIFPNHGTRELGKGLQRKLFKQAQL